MAIESFRLVVAAATALVAATFYVLIGTGITTKKRNKGPRGLTNSGRACFMNAVLQAFASTTVFQEWLERCQPSPLKQGLVKCLRVVNRQEDAASEEITPTDLFVALRSQGFVLTGEEQDAHELVQGLLDVIESDEPEQIDALNDKVNTLLRLEEDDQNVAILPKKPGSVLNRLGGRFEPQNSSNLEKEFPFSGTTMTCVNQNQKQRSPTKSLTFNNITLYLPSMEERLVLNYGDISLESLLDSFVRLEKVDEVTKQQSFAKLPTCLCLHIQRTAFDGIRAYKRREKVTFPFFLHMDQFIYSKQLYEKMSLSSCKGFSRSQGTTPVEEKRNVYSLCAVICHLGDIEAGHYITYRKCLIPGGKVRWFCTSDAEVTQVTLELVMDANPYILLYEKFTLKSEKVVSSTSHDLSPLTNCSIRQNAKS